MSTITPTTPTKKSAIKTFKAPSYQVEQANLADDEELVKKVLGFAQTAYNFYETHPSRVDFQKKAQLADKMFRCSRIRDSEEKQFDNTNSNVATTAPFQRLNTVTSNENSIYFPSIGDMPMTYTPIDGSMDYQVEEGRRIAQHHNLLLQYTFEKDQTEETLRDSIYKLNKYGNIMFEAGWDYRVEERRGRKMKLKDGVKTFSWVKEEFKIANHPTLQARSHDEMYFDPRIDDMQKQSAILRYDNVNYQTLAGLQATGQAMNVLDITDQYLVKGSNEATKSLDERLENAGESQTSAPSTLYERWTCWLRVPVKMMGEGKKAKGKWDPEGTVPTWFRATFIGEVRGNPLCIELIENPFFDNENPYKWVHSHRDEKGAYHMGFVDLIESLYHELTTTVNQMIDNKTLINRAPLITQKNNLIGVDYSFDNNKVLFTRRAATQDSIRQVDVKDHTQTFITQYDRIIDELDAAMNTGKAIIGIAQGSRTSASESKQIFDQAFKTLLDKASYQADQIFPWMACKIRDLWRQYADTDLTLSITGEDEIHEVKPAELWGNLNVRVTAIKKFDTDITRRSEQNEFFGVWKQEFVNLAGPEGTAKALIEMMDERSLFKDAPSLFPVGMNKDTKRVARMENDGLYFGETFEEPEEDDNHQVHIDEHTMFLASVANLRPEEQSEEGLRVTKQHIQIHEQMLQAQSAQAPAAAPGGQPAQDPQSAPATPALEGELIGDQIAGLAGGAN